MFIFLNIDNLKRYVLQLVMNLINHHNAPFNKNISEDF